MDDLSTLLREAVDNVDPAPRYRELWDGVTVATHRRSRRRWVGGLAAAAVFLVAGGVAATHHSTDSEPQPAGPPRAIDHGESRTVYGIYYAGSTPNGPRLYREFRAGPDNQKDLADALSLLVARPSDPDYTSYWRQGQLLGATVEDGVIQVEVDPAVTRKSDVTNGRLALQQLIYTLQGVVGGREPVQFVHAGNPVAEVFGQPTSEPLAQEPELDVLALASISDPSDRRVVHGEFSARGVASSFEGTVPWELRRGAADGTVVRRGTAQTYGWVDRLYPWATGRIDVSDLTPGEYTFVVRTDDPSNGEGPGPTVDTRTVFIK
jgi:hypothetical protein